MKILWISRHRMSPEQLNDLHRLYGKDIQIEQVDCTVTQYQEILELGKDCDVFAAVLPLHILAPLTDPSINKKPVIQSVSERIPTGEKKWNPDTQHNESVYMFKHEYWIQVLHVDVCRLGENH